ncbi:MAG: stage II sporulation protein M [Oscillospiraceae bacterium]|nr:stage II sporulation protein M [Oscillospiraceae bacterium]
MKRLASLPLFQNIKSTKIVPGGGLSRLPGPDIKKYTAALERSWQKLALLGLYALGLFLGAKTAGTASSGWQARLLELLRAQRLGRADLSPFGSAMGYFGTDFLFLLAAFLLGLCAAGLPFLLLLPVLRGMGVGVVSGWLYMTCGLPGVGYSVLVLCPAAVVSVLVMLTYCKESMLMSGDMLLVLNNKQDKMESSLRLYITRYLVLLLVSVLAAALDALCFAAFSGIFEI